MQHFWSKASFVWSDQVVIGPCSHPCCPLLCRRTHCEEIKKAARKASDLELLEWQQQRAARLGLRWPPKPQNAKRAGRPTFARLWVLALEQAIRDGHLPDHVESAMPPWWRPGMPVWRSESDVAADMEDASRPEPVVEQIDLTEDSSDVELCPTSKKRARRNVCSPAAKEWFCNLTVCHPDWSVSDCIRYAQRLAPDLFQMHIQTPRKWLRPGHAHARPAVLGPAHVTELVDLGRRISEGVSCGSSVFRFAFNQRLEALGCTYRFGPRDCRRFLRQMDLKWRQPAGEKRKWSSSDVREHRELDSQRRWCASQQTVQHRRDSDKALAHRRQRMAPTRSCTHSEQGVHHDGARNALWLTRFTGSVRISGEDEGLRTHPRVLVHPDLAHGVTLVLNSNVGGLCGVHRPDLVQSPRTSSYRCMGAVVGCMHDAHLTGHIG